MAQLLTSAWIEEFTCDFCRSFSLSRCVSKEVITQKRQIKGEATMGRCPSDRMFGAEHPEGQFKAS